MPTLIVLLGVAAGHAQEPELVTDRPDQTESAVTVPKGLYQLEAGWSYGEVEIESSQLTFQGFPQALLRVGLTGSLELRLGLPGWEIEKEDRVTGDRTSQGLVDATVGFKVVLADEKNAWPQIAFLGTLILPSGDEEFRAERADPAFRFAIEHTLSQRLTLGYNLGMFWLSERHDEDALETSAFVDWTLVLGVEMNDRAGMFVEAFGVAGVDKAGETVTSFDGGFTYQLTPRLQLDASLTAGLSSLAPDWALGLGISYRFPRFKG